MRAKAIMIQGTGSHVGKSVLTAALCRIFKQDGHRVSPFKSQNMALNSFVTRDGGEMGRAQVVQAQAAGIEPSVDMNPILLKPTGDMKSQVIVMGKPLENMTAREYHDDYVVEAMKVVQAAYNRLSQAYDIIVIEGAGSPVEINLKDTEIVNMRIAKMADAPVILVTDIDKGGALAWVVGTLELLDPDERERVKGIVINKFRGDRELLNPAIDFLEQKTGKPVLGVIPYFKGFSIPEEDSVPEVKVLKSRVRDLPEKLDVAVIYLPHISNFTDFDPIDEEPDVDLRYIKRRRDLGNPDLIILPGTKNTIDDLISLKETGMAEDIIKLANQGTPVMGICGGFQMLGKKLYDPHHTESQREEASGLGLLDIETTFYPEKTTRQVWGQVMGRGLFFDGLRGERVRGYEIHMGKTRLGAGVVPAFKITRDPYGEINIDDGAVKDNGLIFGTYIHGIFDNDLFRRSFINKLRVRRGWDPLEVEAEYCYDKALERDFNMLADTVRANMDMGEIYKIMGLKEKYL